MPAGIQETVNGFVQLFEDDRLNSQEKITEALLELATSLPESHYDLFFRRILSPSSGDIEPTLALILSSTECADVIGKWLCNHFSSSPEDFSGSLAASVLTNLSHFLPFAYPFERETLLELGSYRARVEYAPRVIQALIESRQRAAAPEPISPITTDAELGMKIKQSQRQRKSAKVYTKSVFDAALMKAFSAFRIDIPNGDDDGYEHVFTILEEQLDILKFYLDTLRDEAVEASIRRRYMPQESSVEEPTTASALNEKHLPEESSSITSTPAAFPMVQPMKAALYFDSAEGFGEWRILISTRADRDLREARRKDPNSFKIIIKKIKELSKGHFSDDNQKRLNGPNTEIPIYEAKMKRDSRLIIDCIPEYDASVERQIIKIFGVYTHAQIDKRLWDSIGHQLARKGREYRRRCLFRNRPHVAGDNVFPPACFPPAEQVREEDSVIPELPRESLEEMHSLLVLEKFVPFSQALLNSIIADLDVAYVFNVSPQEKEIIEHPYSCYVLGRSGTGKTTTMLFKMLGIERAYAMRKDSMPKPRQIFVTQSRVLAGKVEDYFTKLLESLSTAERTREELAQLIKTKKQEQDDGLIDIDDDRNWRGDLPQKFSQLQDEHFPLFVTFDRLASLLEADISQNSTRGISSGDNSIPDTSGNAVKASKLITYETFLESYWPRFTQNLKKGLDPALVFSELMGVIQGSEESLSHENRFLDKNSYENLSHRAQYAFASRRDTIYSIFLLYLKQKYSNNEYDVADRTHRLLNAFQALGIPGQKIDYLYVDEAQDNLLIDALLLRSLVRNPDGLFWAGDTAQTISVGSSFRFNDLKAFLFRLEKRREESILGNNSAFMQEAPQTFQLAINYRSHGGIIQCAHSVIELITEFWPYAIDILSRERGVVDGSKPVFFSGWDSDTVRYEQFLFGESGSPIEFGAQQCILVRDEAAREELRKQVGDIGLIMTLYESKGLEFDDVLLYKFFEHSTVDLSQWRIVLNLLANTQCSQDMSAPRFDEIRHAGVCSELKFLYVAITRARKNLWIVDCSEKSEPMRVFWTSRNEIQNCTPGTDVPRLAVSSSPEEWEKSGRTLFSNKRYLQAMHCFERAGLDREVAVSHTYYLREQARSISPTSSKQCVSLRQQAFLAAAEAFVQCSVSAINSKETKAYLRSAGDCFEHAQEDFRAADAFSRAGEYNNAVKLYRKCAKFDEAVAIVTSNRRDIEMEVAENIIDIARLFYFKGGELEKATQLFDSVEEQLEYLEDFDLDVSRAALLEKLGKFQDAADIHFAEGRTLEAIRLFLMDENDETSIRRGYHCILQGLWEKASFGVKSLDRIEEVVRLLALASKVKSLGMLDSIDTDELSMFQAIKAGDAKGLRTLGKKFASKGSSASAVMCFDHCFSSLPNMYTMPLVDVSDILGDFFAYCNLLRRIVNLPNPCNSPRIQKLFSIQPSTENTFFLPNATFLHNKVLESRTPLTGSNEQGVFISEWELSRKLKEHLIIRLKSGINGENEACRQAQAFNPCASFVVNQYCNRKECPHQHILSASLTREWYNLRARIHLQQILILQVLLSLPFNPIDRIRYLREWIHRVFETFYPVWFRLGGVANLDIASIPESQNAFAVLKSWCLDVLYWGGHRLEAKLLTTVYQVVKLCFYLDKPKALAHIPRAPLTNMFRPYSQFSCRNGDASTTYVIPELVHALSTVNADSVSRGIFFFKHVLDTMLPIDANVLCQTIDFLCGSIILVRRNFVLHNISLPRSWLKSLLQAVNLADVKWKVDVGQQINVFVASLRKLVDSLYMGKQQLAHLLVEKSDLFNLVGPRNIYLARICRAICLLGYNVNNIPLRTEILKIMKSLKTNKPPHNLFKDYAHAKQWWDLARLVRKSTSDSPLDEMILLSHESEKPSPYPPPYGVRRVTYKSIVDIPRLVDNTQSSLVSNLRPDAPVFVPKPRLPEAPAADDAELEQDIEEPEADNIEIINTASSVDSITVTALPDVDSPPSEEQIKAALVIQTKCRELMKRRRKTAKSSLDMSRTSCFEECLAESRKIEWPMGSFYRLLFLGPLPHVLVCLKSFHTWAIDTKKRNKKRYKVASHQELEDINKRLTEQKKIIDRIQALQKALNPPSQLHRRRDIEELKKRVLEVEALLSQIAPNVAREVSEDMARGIKGIVAVKQVPKPRPKPRLRIDDVDECDYVDEDVEERDDHSEPAEVVDDIVQESIVVVTDSYARKEDPGTDIFIQNEVPSVQDKAPSMHAEVPSTVMQSLTWVPVLPANTNALPVQGEDRALQQQPDEAGDSSSDSDSSNLDALVMQSLSWIPI
ncbi:hypothetical protein BDZ97DRAFT_421872 [Flammula alnicola]|nr:hypothetical protein BDZ97DRAFT_421872 [Flammula alnicola]